MKTIGTFIIGMLTAGMLVSPAQAQPGATQDADDTSYKNDMRAVYHDDSGDTITYYLQFYGSNIDPSEWRCYLGLDFNEDSGAPRPPSGPQAEEDALIDISLEQSSATLHNRDYSYSYDGNLTRTAVGSPHSATGSTAQNTLRITMTKSAFVQAGMVSGDTGYKYAVGCGAASPPGSWGEYPDHGDRVPDNYEQYPIVHTFGGGTAATPEPPVRTPTPPTPAPSTAPPPPSTPEPPTQTEPPTPEAVRATIAPPTLDAAGTDASPTVPPLSVEETSGSSGLVGIAAVAATVLAAGGVGGLVLWRRRAGI